MIKPKTFTRLLLFTSLAFALFACSERKEAESVLVLRGATIIDCTGAPAQADMTVVIKGDRIAALGKTGKVETPKNAQVVDATGKYLIPGLWDMHVHVTMAASTYESGREAAVTLPLFLAYGVTGVRDMGSDPDLVFLWRREIAEGDRLGPRIITPGAMIYGPVLWRANSPLNIQVRTPDEGRAAVKEMIRLGADFIKVHSWLSRETYFAVIDEASRRGFFIAGHVPPPVRFEEAVEAGLRGIEHQIGLPIALSREEPKLLAGLLEAMHCTPDLAAKFMAMIRTDAAAVDTYDEEVARRLFERFAELEVWICPTLTDTRAYTVKKDSLRADPRLKYFPGSIVDQWISDTDELTPEEVAYWKKLLPASLRSVGAMHRAGVRFLAGTDVGNAYDFPGSDLHRELSLFVEAGLSPLAALQTATRNAAEAVGMLESLGTVEVGKIADLVLLEANPLEDISNTQRIDAVVVGGKFLPKESLQKMLAEVEAAAGRM